MRAAGSRTGARPYEIAFVNNMPSSAFDATEQQFAGLLEGAAKELRRYHRAPQPVRPVGDSSAPRS